MSKEEIDRIENEINVKTNLLFALADIQEGLIVDIESHAMSLNSYQFNLKHKVGTIKRVTGELRAFVNKTFNKKQIRMNCSALLPMISKNCYSILSAKRNVQSANRKKFSQQRWSTQSARSVKLNLLISVWQR